MLLFILFDLGFRAFLSCTFLLLRSQLKQFLAKKSTDKNIFFERINFA